MPEDTSAQNKRDFYSSTLQSLSDFSLNPLIDNNEWRANWSPVSIISTRIKECKVQYNVRLPNWFDG